jgi:hypothetical protein
MRKHLCVPEAGRHCVWEIRCVAFQRQVIHISEINLRLWPSRAQSSGRSRPYLLMLRIIVEANVEIIVAGIHGDFLVDAFEEVVSSNPA